MEQDTTTKAVIALADLVSRTAPARIEEGRRLAYRALQDTGGCWFLDTDTLAAIDGLQERRFHLPRVMRSIHPALDRTDEVFEVEDYDTSTRPVVIGPDLAQQLVLHCNALASQHEGMRKYIDACKAQLKENRREIDLLNAKLEAAKSRYASLEQVVAHLDFMLRLLLSLPKIAKLAGRVGFLRRFGVVRITRGVYMLTPGKD